LRTITERWDGPATNRSITDSGIDQRHRRPTATFPVGIALARVQEPGYRSATTEGWGQGAYSIVTTRDVESAEQLARVSKLPLVHGVSPISRLLLPDQLDDDRPLRKAATAMNAQMLLIYTIGTTIHVEDMAKPVSVVTLGMSPTQQARVISTASALLVDSDTGYIYGSAEYTSKENQLASAWTNEAAIEQSRRRAEVEAFEGLVTEFEKLWPTILSRFGPGAATPP
jgi:hypothetical protein